MEGAFSDWPISEGGPVVISFKGAQFPKDVILFAVFFYVRYSVGEGASAR